MSDIKTTTIILTTLGYASSEGLSHSQKRDAGTDKLRKVVDAVKRRLEQAMDVDIDTPHTTRKRRRLESGDDLARYVRGKTLFAHSI